MTATIVYEGHLRCQATHIQSNTSIETDAPSDNRGKGERFSPTDLVCTALATCMLTTMAIKAQDMGIELAGMKAEVTKYMVSDPRRIGKINVSVFIPSALALDEKDKTILERTGNLCPVAKSLHPNLELNLNYFYV